MRALFLALAFSAAGPAAAAVVAGRDCANGDLVCDGATPVCGGAELCSNGTELQGTFTRVKLFSLPAGTTVFVFPATPLAIYASTLSIGGTLDGSGRGAAGGQGGPNLSAGQSGSGGGLSSAGGGGGGPASGGGGAPGKGGGGGGHGDYGGLGGGSGVSGSSGTSIGAAAFVTSPISANDVSQGSGGGGGGGGPAAATVPGGAGGPGGGAVYLEASSVTIFGAGSILVNGGSGSQVAQNSVDSIPGSGGGGAGGGVVLRVPGVLEAGGWGTIAANGGRGGSIFTLNGGALINPGGGGSGGRIKLFYRSATSFSVSLSTALGVLGARQASGRFESTSTLAGFTNNGSSGTVAFGLIASSPTAPAIVGVHVTSVAYGWSFDVAGSTWGDADPASRKFRVYPSSITAPFSGYQAQSSSDVFRSTETGMAANTWYTRVVTAYSDWGDSLFSLSVTTATLASAPGPAVGVSTFSDVQERQLTLNWGHGSGAEANPSDTEYEVWRSTASDFSVAASTRIVAVSSTPVNLAPETIYYFRVRAVNRLGALSAYTTTFAVATSTTPPAPPGAPVPDNPFSYDGRSTFRWSAASAPSGIKEYFLEIGSFPGGADFVSRSVGTALSYSVTGPLLSSGKSYYARVRAVSNANVTSDFSATGSPVSVFITAQETPVSKPSGWPNPMDPSAGPANIGFSVAEAATVVLKIFTLQGRLVHEESRRYDTAGNKVLLWDGLSSAGRKVAPGGYVVVIEKRYAGSVDVQKFKMAVLY